MMKLFSATRGAIIALGLSTLGVPPAIAQQATAIDEQSIVSLLKGEGLKAEVTYDDWSGAPIVNSYWDGVKGNFEVRLDACDEDGFDCEVLIFSAGFFFDDNKTPAATHEKINEWNYNNLGKAFVDEEGTMWITTESSIVGGVTKENLADTLHWFEGLMRDYTIHIGWQAN